MADLTGVRAKISRAKEHFDKLKETGLAWLRAPGNAIHASIVEDKPEGKYHTVVSQATPLPPEIPLMIGDVVHNLRCALDHLVCQLAVVAGNPAACRETQFPICSVHSAGNQARVRKWLGPIRPEAADAIKDLQPYKRRPANPQSDPLWIIHELDNIDKHSMIIVVLPDIANIQRISAEGVETVLRPTETWQREVHGTHIFGTSAPIPEPHAKVNVDTQLELRILFQNTGCCDGERVLPTLSVLIGEVEAIVNDFYGRGWF